MSTQFTLKIASFARRFAREKRRFYAEKSRFSKSINFVFSL